MFAEVLKKIDEYKRGFLQPIKLYIKVIKFVLVYQKIEEMIIK